MRTQPERLQDPKVAQEFEAIYDDMVSRQIPGKLLPQFKEQAEAMGTDSVLAASVVAHLDPKVIEGRKYSRISGKQSAIESAKTAADKLVTLDAFLRNPRNQEDLVLYSEDRDPDRGRFLGVYLTVADGSWVGSFPNARHETDEDSFLVDFDVKYGVGPLLIADGHAVSSLQGTRNYQPGDDQNRNGFMRSLTMLYPEVSQGVYWRNDRAIPAVTIGQSAIMGLFENMIRGDFEEAATENRYRRASYLLYRSARMLGHSAADEMQAVAENGIVFRLWHQQLVTEIARRALSAIDKSRIGDDHLIQKIRFEVMARSVSDEINWLNVNRAEVITEAIQDAQAHKMDIETGEIELTVDTAFTK